MLTINLHAPSKIDKIKLQEFTIYILFLFRFENFTFEKVNRFVFLNATAIPIQGVPKNRCQPICPLIVRKHPMH